VPFGREAGVVNDSPCPTERENAFCAVNPDESLAVAVNWNVPLDVGVPEITPPPLKFNPAGREPDVMLHVYGGVPPVAASV
jgi:hypothetical protein